VTFLHSFETNGKKALLVQAPSNSSTLLERIRRASCSAAQSSIMLTSRAAGELSWMASCPFAQLFVHHNSRSPS